MKKLDLRIIKNNIKIGNKTFYDIYVYRMYDILKFGIATYQTPERKDRNENPHGVF